MIIGRFVNFIWDEFVHGAHLLSLGIVFIIVSAKILLQTNFSLAFLLIVYLIPLLIYSYNRYKELDQDIISNPERSEFLKKQKNFFPIFVFLYLFALLFLIFLYSDIQLGLFVVLLIFLGVLYTLFLKRLTKIIIGFKNFFVAFTISLLIPLLAFYFNHPLDLSVLFISSFVFIKTFVNTSFCDLKDVITDKQEGLKTFVVYFGEKRALNFLKLMSIISITPLFLGVYFEVLPLYSLFLILTVVFNFYYFNEYEKDNSKKEWIFNYLVDLEFYFWPIFLILGGYLLNLYL